ncbi:HTH domain-containing protein [Lactobacillus sp. R2/2]|nr:HTH domain-containing protein [Lactobacillus sp. R2/2]
MQVQFNQSQLKIIDLLVKVKYFMTVGDMSEKVKVSERSVYKNLSSLNKKLKTLDIEGTRNVYGQGYYLSEKANNRYRST